MALFDSVPSVPVPKEGSRLSSGDLTDAADFGACFQLVGIVRRLPHHLPAFWKVFRLVVDARVLFLIQSPQNLLKRAALSSVYLTVCWIFLCPM